MASTVKVWIKEICRISSTTLTMPRHMPAQSGTKANGLQPRYHLWVLFSSLRMLSSSSENPSSLTHIQSHRVIKRAAYIWPSISIVFSSPYTSYFQELIRKGISSPTVREAVKKVFGQKAEGAWVDDGFGKGYESSDENEDTLQGKTRMFAHCMSIQRHTWVLSCRAHCSVCHMSIRLI